MQENMRKFGLNWEKAVCTSNDLKQISKVITSLVFKKDLKKYYTTTFWTTATNIKFFFIAFCFFVLYCRLL